MSRIPTNDYQYAKDVLLPIAIGRSANFQEIASKYNFSNLDVCRDFISNIVIDYDLTDIMYHSANGFWFASENDTHSKNRLFEKFFGGRCDGKPLPDIEDGEIKLTQIVKSHILEQVITIGTICPQNVIYNKFEESSVYKKLSKMLVVSYYQESKQLGRKFFNPFVFEVNNEIWFSRIKEDWEYYYSEYKSNLEEYRKSVRIKKASGIMKSDTNGKRCPNNTLGIRSDSIIFPKSFFKEVSEHYAGI